MQLQMVASFTIAMILIFSLIIKSKENNGNYANISDFENLLHSQYLLDEYRLNLAYKFEKRRIPYRE